MNSLFENFKINTKRKGEPAIIEYINGEETFISAANIFTSVLDKAKEFKSYGIKTGDIFIDIPDSYYSIINFYACVKIGAIYFPISPDQVQPIESKLERNINQRKVFLGEKIIGHSCWKFLDSDKNYALILQTSGTKNKKEVAITCDGLDFQLEAHKEVFEDFQHEHKLSVLPKFHCFGFILDLLLGIRLEKYITLFDKNSFNSKNLLDVIKKDGIDLISGVPKHLELFQRYCESNQELKDLCQNIYFYYGGAPIHEKLENSANQIFKGLIQGYGLTEAGPGVMINKKPLPGIDVKLKEGNLYFRSPSAGDYEDKVLENDFIKTNDYFSFDGLSYKHLGRDDEFIKSSNGVMRSHFEIEELIYKRFSYRTMILTQDGIKKLVIEHENPLFDHTDFLNWLESEFPSPLKVSVVGKNKITKLLSENKGKSLKDIFNKQLNQLVS